MLSVFTVFWVIAFGLIFSKLFKVFQRKKEEFTIMKLYKDCNSTNINEFLQKRKNSKSIYKLDFVGIYILYNENNKKYYVGQSINVYKRINNHFTGNGCSSVYKDFNNGHVFNFKTIPLSDSGFKNLNRLEKVAIYVFRGYSKGYNKTRGNK